MDIRKIKKLIELLEESTLTELEISEGEESIRLSRRSPLDPAESTSPAPPSTRLTEAPTSSSTAATVEDLPGTVPVVSPMVGTFYTASSPSVDPFVTEGAQIKVGDVICVVEAMKLFNEIESELSGTVEKILVDNASPVEYGQALMMIRVA